jgi:hypothetical protein
MEAIEDKSKPVTDSKAERKAKKALAGIGTMR